MPIINLRGTVWRINSGFVVVNLPDFINVDGHISYKDSDNTHIEFDFFAFGFSTRGFVLSKLATWENGLCDNVTVLPTSTDIIISFTGDVDIANPDLIAWFDANGTPQTPTGEESNQTRILKFTRLNIGNTVSTVGGFAFKRLMKESGESGGGDTPDVPEATEGLAYELSDDGTYYICSGIGTATDTDIVIANEIDGIPVTSIGEHSFSGCTSLTSITIPDSVTYIREYAFENCSKLTDVYYTGTEEQWNAISIGSGNATLTSATIHYNYVPPFRIINKLDGSTLSKIGDVHEIHYQYEFENGIPDTVVLNGESSSDSITVYMDKEHRITATVNGLISICSPVFASAEAELNCHIEFLCKEQTDTDSFTAYTDNGFICFAAGTLIKTPTGYKPVEEIKEGEAVSAYNFMTESVEDDEVFYFHWENGVTSIQYITFENGTRIGVTDTHALMTEDGWKCCAPNEHTISSEQLVVGDKVQTANGNYTKVIAIEADPTPQPVYHLSLTNNNCLIVTNTEDNEPVLAEHLMMEPALMVYSHVGGSN